MNKPDTTRPLAERITQRPAIRNADTVWLGGASISCAPFNREEGRCNAELVEEAFNVTHETGRTPRQLADERAELTATLEAITERAEAVSEGILVHKRHKGVSQATHVAHMAGHLAQHCKPARALLARLNP